MGSDRATKLVNKSVPTPIKTSPTHREVEAEVVVRVLDDAANEWLGHRLATCQLGVRAMLQESYCALLPGCLAHPAIPELLLPSRIA